MQTTVRSSPLLDRHAMNASIFPYHPARAACVPLPAARTFVQPQQQRTQAPARASPLRVGRIAAPTSTSTSTSTAAPPSTLAAPPAPALPTLFGLSPSGTIAALVGGGAALCLAGAAAGVFIDSNATPICDLQPAGCAEIPLFMKVPLIATHLFAFVLMPTSMFVFWRRSEALSKAGACSPLTAMIGFSYLMVSIAGEIGWHVSQHWRYSETYDVLNAMFYAFLLLGTALWAVGINDPDDSPEWMRGVEEKVDTALLASPALGMLVYGLAAATHGSKVPIYILLSLEYAVLTWRFWKLLKTPKVLLFPFFSVGVNLTFISLLDKNIDSPILNPLYHILHDAAGTLLGVAIITGMVYFDLAPKPEGTDTAAELSEAADSAAAKRR